MALSPDQEKQLLQEIRAKEKGAWERFIQEYSRLIYYSIQRTCQIKTYLLSPEEREELFHDIFVHLIANDGKKLRQFKGKSGCSLATWIRTVSTHYVLDHIRKSNRKYFQVEFIELGDEQHEIIIIDQDDMPDQLLEEKEKEELVAEALGELGDEDRRFVELYYIRDLSPREIARILKISQGSIYSRVNRLKSRLREKIEEKKARNRE
jgi:RNA polymerase sigma-70 factor (ECF subfamily)